jgi:catechol-2,3-dioxygenase
MGAVTRPKLHHVNLKTTRLEELIDFYTTLIGAEVQYRFESGAWLTNDGANHRIALLAFPNFADDPDKAEHTGMHHTAFEYDAFEELNATYLRLKGEGILPVMCLDHGMTLSYYYADPDGNQVELQVDCFGDWQSSTEFVRVSEDFRRDPLGPLVDPERVAGAAAAGATFADIHRRARAGELGPSS